MQVQYAREHLLHTEFPDSLRLTLAERAHAAGLEGMRAELAILRTARAAAALQKAATVSAQNFEEAWGLCVGHRLNPDAAERPHNTPPPQPPKQHAPHHPSAPDAPQTPPHRFDLLHAPTQAPPTSHAPMHAPSSSSQPSTPLDAQASTILLRAPVKPKILAFPEPTPLRRLTAQLRGARSLTARLETSRLQPGPVRWQASVLASLRNGWRPSTPGWRWAQACVRPLRRLWVLLDASRSTGSAQFLSSARDQITSQLRPPLKVNLLVVHKSEVLWQARNVSPKRATQALQSIPNAQGKSPITQAISTFRRALCAAAPTVKDTVLICSDGFPSLTPGETSTRAGARLRSALQRLTRNLPAPAVWLSPQPQRGMDHWLSRILRGTGILLCRLPQERSLQFPAH
jgi:hypothetical protein